MITERTVEIAAPAEVVWDVYADVEHWAEWTASIRSVVPLDGSGLALGRRFAVTQPRLPKLTWEVVDLVPGASWRWRQRSLGATTVAWHEVEALGPDRTLARLGLDQQGPLGVLVGALSSRLTKRYLDLEAEGLRSRSEARVAGDAASA